MSWAFIKNQKINQLVEKRIHYLLGSLGVEPRPLDFQSSVTQNQVHQEPDVFF